MIVKVTIPLMILMQVDDMEHAQREISGRGLEDILYEISEGRFIGDNGKWKASYEEIPPDQVQTELYAIDNDGTFFDED